eukprot:CAMPEP_0168525304 /NCGR_PEP_ID=MMETSP0405-20121227/11216_1 /TAXON_ID=498012 /ORGANISM="Trichosphaerium sp, Strain Am-I-7 wt" /LENGTH=176 /DNA_ID=CAMNT_0008547777 /DNA_START=84 /DNA_END=614 /DNA_ORIENTATION=-
MDTLFNPQTQNDQVKPSSPKINKLKPSSRSVSWGANTFKIMNSSLPISEAKDITESKPKPKQAPKSVLKQSFPSVVESETPNTPKRAISSTPAFYSPTKRKQAQTGKTLSDQELFRRKARTRAFLRSQEASLPLYTKTRRYKSNSKQDNFKNVYVVMTMVAGIFLSIPFVVEMLYV